MNNMKITAWLPIFKPFKWVDEPEIPFNHYEVLNSFVSDLGNAFEFFINLPFKINAKLAIPPPRIISHLKNLNPQSELSVERFDFVCVNITTNYDDYCKLLSNTNQSHTKDLFVSLMACNIADAFFEIRIISEIAFPGVLSSVIGCTFSKSRPHNSIDKLYSLRADLLYSKDIKWPSINCVPLKTMMVWKPLANLFGSGYSTSAIERSIASFTRLLGDSSIDGDEMLFWAMQGLEALYCRGNGDLRRQLSEKTRLFLGPWNDAKNIVGHLYDFRSKFVHGSFNLSKFNNNYFPQDESEKDDRMLEDSTALAVRMLVASIQKCAINNIQQLEFTYSIEAQ